VCNISLTVRTTIIGLLYFLPCIALAEGKGCLQFVVNFNFVVHSKLSLYAIFANKCVGLLAPAPKPFAHTFEEGVPSIIPELLSMTPSPYHGTWIRHW